MIGMIQMLVVGITTAAAIIWVAAASPRTSSATPITSKSPARSDAEMLDMLNDGAARHDVRGQADVADAGALRHDAGRNPAREGDDGAGRPALSRRE